MIVTSFTSKKKTILSTFPELKHLFRDNLKYEHGPHKGALRAACDTHAEHFPSQIQSHFVKSNNIFNVFRIKIEYLKHERRTHEGALRAACDPQAKHFSSLMKSIYFVKKTQYFQCFQN